MKLLPKPLISFGMLATSRSSMRPVALFATVSNWQTFSVATRKVSDESSSSSRPSLLPVPVLLSTPSKCKVSTEKYGALGKFEVVLPCQWVESNERSLDGPNRTKHVTTYFRRWIQLDWSSPVYISQIVLDSDDMNLVKYEVQIRFSPAHSWETIVNVTGKAHSPSDQTDEDCSFHRSHDIDNAFPKSTMSLRLYMHKAVSELGTDVLWRIQVFGHETTDGPELVAVTSNEVGESGFGVQNLLSSGTDIERDRWLVLPENLYILPGNVCGGLWVRIDYRQPVFISLVQLDWCGICTHDYTVQLLAGSSGDEWKTIEHRIVKSVESPFLSLEPDATALATVPPGAAMPREETHDVHKIKVDPPQGHTRALRLWIHTAHRSDVSLWQIRVHGRKA